MLLHSDTVQLLTREECAALLRVDGSTIDGWLATGRVERLETAAVAGLDVPEFLAIGDAELAQRCSSALAERVDLDLAATRLPAAARYRLLRLLAVRADARMRHRSAVGRSPSLSRPRASRRPVRARVRRARRHAGLGVELFAQSAGRARRRRIARTLPAAAVDDSPAQRDEGSARSAPHAHPDPGPERHAVQQPTLQGGDGLSTGEEHHDEWETARVEDGVHSSETIASEAQASSEQRHAQDVSTQPSADVDELLGELAAEPAPVQFSGFGAEPKNAAGTLAAQLKADPRLAVWEVISQSEEEPEPVGEHSWAAAPDQAETQATDDRARSDLSLSLRELNRALWDIRRDVATAKELAKGSMREVEALRGALKAGDRGGPVDSFDDGIDGCGEGQQGAAAVASSGAAAAARGAMRGVKGSAGVAQPGATGSDVPREWIVLLALALAGVWGAITYLRTGNLRLTLGILIGVNLAACAVIWYVGSRWDRRAVSAARP